MKTRIEDLELSSRTISQLSRRQTSAPWAALLAKREEDLMEIEGLGPKSIQEVKRALANFGIILK
jgi:DNA-directed RNA polymerase alpha subunit